MPLPKPVERQLEVVCLPAKGHQVVLGTAGSGKTTMAILRAAYLSDVELPGSGATLLITFNKALVGYIRSLADNSLRNVTVENYHRFARGYLNSQGKMKRNAVVGSVTRKRLIEIAVEKVQLGYKPHAFFSRPLAFFDAEIEWLMNHGIESADDYAAVDRVGRAEARLERSLRQTMWKVYETYLQIRASSGFLYDWGDLAGAVDEALSQDNSTRRYRHVVIDEGQDLSPQMLRSLARAVPKDGTITLFGDVAQQIYGHRMSWRSAGLLPTKIWYFSENYRNSREIAALGLAIAEMPYYAGAPDMVQPTTPSAAGPLPTLVQHSSETEETKFVVEQAKRLAQTQSVAILARTVRQVENLLSKLPRHAINLREDSSDWSAGPNLFVGTYHSAKGIEFDAVLLPYLSDDLFPDSATVADFGSDEAAAMEGRLLYVGVTSAKRALIISYHGSPSTLLPGNPALYTKVTR